MHFSVCARAYQPAHTTRGDQPARARATAVPLTTRSWPTERARAQTQDEWRVYTRDHLCTRRVLHVDFEHSKFGGLLVSARVMREMKSEKFGLHAAAAAADARAAPLTYFPSTASRVARRAKTRHY